MILNYCKKKSFLLYCPKLYGLGLKPGTFEFVTYLPNDLTNYAIDYEGGLKSFRPQHEDSSTRQEKLVNVVVHLLEVTH